jgi:Rho-binding antiterminator
MISCQIHDYVEIACMYCIEVKLALKNNQTIQGVALQTAYSDNKEECIVIRTKRGDEQVVLDHVVSMEAVTINSHFNKINFYAE